jgi:D-sedoheptulose 7-phosphate isomerase
MNEHPPQDPRLLRLGPAEGPAWAALQRLAENARRRGEALVTTSGCFDLLHPGHVRLLEQARAMGDLLIVGLNGDASIRALKGPARPLLPETVRAEMLLALRSVDGVVIFDELTPVRLLDRLRPAIHCKGGDYRASELPERQTVERHGGAIRIVPRIPEFATSALVEDIRARPQSSPSRPSHPYCRQAAELLFTVAAELGGAIEEEGRRLAAVLERGGTILCCGNGGSAADAQHLAGELVGRFTMIRPGLRALALSADSAVVTCIGNDFGFEKVFSRQVQALGRPGDALVLISTSGNSPNMVEAARAARALGITTIGLTGEAGGQMRRDLDHCVCIPSRDTAMVQQGHRAVLHAWCSTIEASLASRHDNAA